MVGVPVADGSFADAIPAALVVEEAELSDAAEFESLAAEEADVAVDASLEAVAIEAAETEVVPYASI